MRNADGVQAPVLFRIPLLSNALIGFGCCTPATKKDMHRLFKNKAWAPPATYLPPTIRTQHPSLRTTTHHHALPTHQYCTPSCSLACAHPLQIDFGILPGGMEEVALYTKGRERVYLKKRAGFIKYALQHGYLVQPAYTFGESDMYTSLQHPLYRKLCMWTLKNGGFVAPVFWGPRWWYVAVE